MGKIAELKDIRRRSRNLDQKDPEFSKQLVSLTREMLEHLEEPDDQQEMKWAEKSLKVMGDPQERSSKMNETDKDLALSYLKEALNSVIIREENLLE